MSDQSITKTNSDSIINTGGEGVNENNTNLYTRNIVLSELITGIIVYGIISQLILIPISIMWLEKNILYYSLGLWMGIMVAPLLAIHMNNSISKALDFDEESAVKIVKKDSIIRYIILVIIFGLLMVTDIVSPIAAFVGVTGLKIGAYIQPITHKALRKIGPKFVREYIADDDSRRQMMLEEYYEEQKRIEEEKANAAADDGQQENSGTDSVINEGI